MNPQVILATALMLISEYKKARDVQASINASIKTGVPDDPNTPEREDMLDDAQIIQLFGGDATQLVVHADQLLTKYHT